MRGLSRVSASALTALIALAAGAGAAPAQAASCPASIDPDHFISASELRSMMRTITGFGLRTTGSRAHEETIDFLEEQMRDLPGMRVRSDAFTIKRWQPLDRSGRARRKPSDLERAGSLTAGGRRVRVAGAVPYSKPTGARGSTGQLTYVPPGRPVTAANAGGKVVILDIPLPPNVGASIPYSALRAISRFHTPDLDDEGNYDRPGGADTPLHELLIDAGQAGAAGVIVAWDLPRHQLRGYFEPHKGTHYRVPALFVGVDERERLKALATDGATAAVAVRARVDRARTRNLIATLPGRSPERVVINANTDGNTWVQENGVTAMVALGRYLSRLPLECRPRTFELVFATAHLHISREGTVRRAEQLDREYDEGTVAFAFALEHLGTREVVAAPRTGGPGRELVLTGKGEPFLWFASETQPLTNAAIWETVKHGLDRTVVLNGAGLPTAGQVPQVCSFGGIGGVWHGQLIPTLAMISGPWSLWAPVFGERAVDFARARGQTLAAGDAILDLQAVPRETIAGPFTGYRRQRAAGTATTCEGPLPPEDAPAAG